MPSLGSAAFAAGTELPGSRNLRLFTGSSLLPCPVPAGSVEPPSIELAIVGQVNVLASSGNLVVTVSTTSAPDGTYNFALRCVTFAPVDLVVVGGVGSASATFPAPPAGSLASLDFSINRDPGQGYLRTQQFVV